MSEYKVSEITREKILSAARRLFYEKGYKNTKYEEICSEAGVNEGTLHYQYKSKAAVGKIINEQAIKKNYDEATALSAGCSSANPLVPFALYNLIYWYKFYSDENYRRFAVEIAKEYKYSNVDEYFSTYTLLPQSIVERVTASKFGKLNEAMIISIDAGVPEYLKEHLDEFTYAEIAEYELLMYAKILEYSQSEMLDAAKQAEAVMQSADLSALDTVL